METLTQQRRKAAKPLLWIGMGSITMAFAGMTSGYVVSRTTLVQNEQWLSFELPPSFLYSTLVIVFSSLVLWYGKTAIKTGNRKTLQGALLSTLLLGLLFSFLQINGWRELTENQVFFTGPGSNPAGSWVYAISVFHLAHLAGGIIALIFTMSKSLKGKYSQEDYLGVSLLSIYWHFMGLLWVYLYVFLSVIR